MTIPEITKTVDGYDVNNIPNRGLPSEFETNMGLSLTYQAELPSDLNELTTQINAASEEMNNTATQVSNDANSAASSESAAASSASAAQTAYSQTLAVKAIVDETEGTITSGDTFSETTAWNNIRTAWETGSHGLPVVLDLDFARDNYSEYGGLSAGYTRAPLLDIVSFSRASIATGKNAFGNIETVGVNEPRVVFDENGAALLIEKDAENLLDWSEDFSQSYWVKVGSTINSDSITIGGFSMDRLVESSDNSAHSMNILGGLTVSAGESYSAYFVVYPDERDILSISFDGGAWGGVAQKVEFNLSNQSYDIEFGVDSAEIKMVGDLYYCRITTQPATVNATVGHRFYLRNSSGNEVYQGDGTSGMYIALAQLEQASTPSSYIKTEGAPVVRAADDFEYALPAGFNGNGDWSLFVDFIPLELVDGNSRFISIYSDSSNKVVIGRNTTTNTLRLIVTSSGSTTIYSLGSVVAGERKKIAVIKNGGDVLAFVNGSEVVNQTSSMPSLLTGLLLGRDEYQTNSSNSKFYKTTLIAEAISDEEARVYTSI